MIIKHEFAKWFFWRTQLQKKNFNKTLVLYFLLLGFCDVKLVSAWDKILLFSISHFWGALWTTTQPPTPTPHKGLLSPKSRKYWSDQPHLLSAQSLWALIVRSTQEHKIILLFKLSRGEICVANFIPPCEWCGSGQVFFVQNLG